MWYKRGQGDKTWSHWKHEDQHLQSDTGHKWGEKNEAQEGSNDFCSGDSHKFNMWVAGHWQWVGFKQVEKEAEDMLGRG